MREPPTKIAFLGDSAIPESPLLRELAARGFSFVSMGELLAHNLTDYSALSLPCKDLSLKNDFYQSIKRHIIHNCPEVAVKALRMASNFNDKLIFVHIEDFQEFSVLQQVYPDIQIIAAAKDYESFYDQNLDSIRKLSMDIPDLGFFFYKGLSKKKVKEHVDRYLSGEKLGGHNPFQLHVLEVGLDISMNRTGVAALCHDCVGKELVVFGELRTRKTENDVHRYRELNQKLLCFEAMSSKKDKYLLDLTQADTVVVEGGALGAVRGAYRLGRHAGLLMSFFADKYLIEIAPTSLKKRFTGYGHASKEMVVRKARKVYRLDFDPSDNVADALGLLWCITH
jgi:Holliday junction resolvasome RuvABC endonuclease subunit